jgi:hypothetical protein
MKLTETIKCRLPSDLMQEVLTHAEQEDLPLSIVVRKAIKLFLARNGTQKTRKGTRRK